MLLILYLSGKHLTKKYKIYSSASIISIIVYTLNEGFRYGRGIDYNSYGLDYQSYIYTGESTQTVGYKLILQLLVLLDQPWQTFVCLMSFFYILATLHLVKAYKETAPLTLPLFCLFSLNLAENMMKWCVAFSFSMIGLYYLLSNRTGSLRKFIVFCSIGCIFHYAFIPVPIVFYLIYKLNKIILPPFFSILLFSGIGILFQTELMLSFANVLNYFSRISDNYTHYADDAAYWLLGGGGGGGKNAFSDKFNLVFYLIIVWFGYKYNKKFDNRYVWAYNIFLLGFILKPIGNQIELAYRYVEVFLFFRVFVIACILQTAYKKKRYSVRVLLLLALTVLSILKLTIVDPIRNIPERYLYVWNSDGKGYYEMKEIITEDNENKANK